MEVTPTESTLPLLQEDMKHRSSEEKHTAPDMGLLESSTQAEIDDIREENGKLKSFLARIMKDYHSLQTQFFDMNYKPVQESKAPVGDQSTSPDEDEDAEKSVLSLSLGLMNNQTLNLEKEDEESEIKDHGQLKGALALGLKSKFEGSGIRRDGHSSNASTGEDSSVEQKNEEEVGEPWPPRSKAARKFGSRETTHDEVSQDSRQPPAKRARVCVRVRCDAPTMNDGCQWRKYGQKISKGNPCPRAYYRCTVAPTCPVRKQVQRCAEDLSILIISYEGIHNHPLPLAARAMASTTTAAASMLMSGASSSITSASPGGASSNTSSITMSAGLQGTNYFTFSDVISAPRQYTSTSHPSITLDFTGTATPPNSGGTQFKLPPGFVLNSRNSTSYNLASNPSESSATPFTSWNNGCSSYGPLPCIKNTKSNNMITSLSLGLRARQSQAANFSIASSLPKATSSQTIPSQRQQLLTDTIAKMITADPSFQSAVAAAITSYIGGGSREVPQGAVGHSGHELQRRDQLSASDEEIFDKISGAARASGFLTTSNSSYSNSKY